MHGSDVHYSLFEHCPAINSDSIEAILLRLLHPLSFYGSRVFIGDNLNNRWEREIY